MVGFRSRSFNLLARTLREGGEVRYGDSFRIQNVIHNLTISQENFNAHINSIWTRLTRKLKPIRSLQIRLTSVCICIDIIDILFIYYDLYTAPCTTA